LTKLKFQWIFSTILEKARQQNYKEIETFKNDILLIFQNATFYNSKGTEVHNAALALEEKFTNMYKMLENIRDNKNQKSKIEIEGHLKDHNGVLEKSKEEYDILNKELSELEKGNNSIDIKSYHTVNPLTPLTDFDEKK